MEENPSNQRKRKQALKFYRKETLSVQNAPKKAKKLILLQTEALQIPFNVFLTSEALFFAALAIKLTFSKMHSKTWSISSLGSFIFLSLPLSVFEICPLLGV